MRTRHRVAVSLLACLGATLLFCSTALAHVTIEPSEAAPGSYTKVAFLVPDERPNASTTKLRVQFPQEKPIASVSVRPVEGWTINVEKVSIPPQPGREGNQITEAVKTITWEGGQIQPDQFEAFEVSMGPLPEGVDQLYFPAIQTYSNGEEVTWIEKPGAGGGTPAFPAPVLVLVPTAGGSVPAGPAGTTAGSIARANPPGTPAPATAAAGSESTTATTIAGLSLGVALVALVLGVVTTGVLLRQRRRTAADGTTS